jgi:PAS domain S-box-containing protein
MRNIAKRNPPAKDEGPARDPEPSLAPESTGSPLFGGGPQNAALLQTVLDSLTHPLYVIDVADYHVRLANRTAQESCKSGAATCYALTHRRDAPCHTQDHPCPVEVVKRTGKPTVVEHVHYDKDGVAKNVEVHAFPIFDEAGRVIQIIEYCVDITERKQAEEELTRAKQEWERTFDAVPDLIAIIDQQHRIMRANRAMAERLGMPPEQCIGLTCYRCVHDLDAPPAYCPHEESLADGREHTIEVYEQRCGGHFLVTCTPLFDPHGQRIGSVHVARDITERKRAEEALRDLNATLEIKVVQRTAELEHRARQLQRLTLELSEAEDQERRRLAEILHDDLQQVLAAAKFHLDLLRNKVKENPSQRATAGQVERMLVEAIDKSRSLSHELSPAVLHYGDFAETLRWLAGQVQAKHGLAVHVDASGPIDLPSDALKAFLYKATQEMLFNVVKHARVREARIRLRPRGAYICLSVLDRGRGFDPQELKTTTGFGLLNIRERVESLGGRMKIRSAKGKGGTFHIIVPDGRKTEDTKRRTEGRGPRAENGSDPTSAFRDPSSEIHSPSSASRFRVLLADDHEIVRQGLASLLSEERDIEVVGEAANGREAVDQAYGLQPDVVIMDVAMPLMNGDEATRQIKRYLPQIRIVALSMYGEVETVERMRRAGAESYVLKTAPSEELLAALRGRQPSS